MSCNPSTVKHTLIALALYPPAKLNTNSKTEKEMKKYLRAFENISWIDFLVHSSDTTNAAIDQYAISTLVDRDGMVKNYFERFFCQMKALPKAEACTPVVYVTGDTCAKAFDSMIRQELLQKIETLCPDQVYLCKIIMGEAKFEFIAVQRPHPSWHLVCARKKKSVNELWRLI